MNGVCFSMTPAGKCNTPNVELMAEAEKKIILQFNLPTATYCMRTPMDQLCVQITF